MNKPRPLELYLGEDRFIWARDPVDGTGFKMYPASGRSQYPPAYPPPPGRGGNGPPGPPGPPGPAGAPGQQGLIGPEGPGGPQGPEGVSVTIKGSVATSSDLPTSGNAPGDIWITTDTGHGWIWTAQGNWVDIGQVHGPRGIQGPVGPQGAAGPQGNSGPQGIPGMTGPQGPPGIMGPTGSTGIQGNQGLTGNPGPLGPPGETGPQGPMGLHGLPGPQGQVGPEGPEGPAGPEGPQGPGITLKGFVPNVNDLPIQGNTVGDIWVTTDSGDGYIWTGAEFQNIGPIQGPRGLQGPQGIQGTQGPQGGIGPTGDTGATGPTGPLGPKGDPGAIGQTGTQGPQGNPGPKGDPGTPGAIGQTGPAGQQGIQGPAGPQGIPGPTGITVGSRYSSIGNPNFEVQQRNPALAPNDINGSMFLADRWSISKNGSIKIAAQIYKNALIAYPGTNSIVTSNKLLVFVSGGSSSLAAGDIALISQAVEGAVMRELIGDVHSVSILMRSTVALKLGLCLLTTNQSLTKLCQLPAGQWTVVKQEGLPLFPGGIPVQPGVQAYNLMIVLAAGSQFVNSANDIWTNNPTGYGAIGQDNWFANPVGSTQLEIAFVQHEPGPVATQAVDKPYQQNLAECKRYFQKTWDIGIQPPAQGFPGPAYAIGNGSATVRSMHRYETEMYQAPQLTLYTQGGVAGSVTLDLPTPVDVAVSAPLAPSTKAIGNITLARTVPVGTPVYFHFTADTGI